MRDDDCDECKQAGRQVGSLDGLGSREGKRRAKQRDRLKEQTIAGH